MTSVTSPAQQKLWWVQSSPNLVNIADGKKPSLPMFCSVRLLQIYRLSSI